MTTPLAELLSADHIRIGVDVDDAAGVFRTLAGLLASPAPAGAKTIDDALAARERLGSTALGHGFAIPHARISGLAKARAAFVRTRSPVEFAAPDRKPVRCFVALIVPAQATEHHLQLLAEAAERLGNSAFRESLRGAQSPHEIAALFSEPIRTGPTSPA